MVSKKTNAKKTTPIESPKEESPTEEKKEEQLYHCITCGSDIKLNAVVKPIHEIAENIAINRNIAIEQIQLGICNKCNNKFMTNRCKHLDKNGSTFCTKRNKRIGVDNPELTYCMCGYRKGWETPHLDCHSQFEKKKVLEI